MYGPTPYRDCPFAWNGPLPAENPGTWQYMTPLRSYVLKEGQELEAAMTTRKRDLMTTRKVKRKKDPKLRRLPKVKMLEGKESVDVKRGYQDGGKSEVKCKILPLYSCENMNRAKDASFQISFIFQNGILSQSTT